MKRRNLKMIKTALQAKCDPNASDIYGATPLIAASDTGYIKGVRWLLTHKASVNKRDHEGRSPLDWAIRSDNAVVVKCLLENKATTGFDDSFALCVMDNSIDSANVLAESGIRVPRGSNVAVKAAKLNQYEITKTLLDAKACVDQKDALQMANRLTPGMISLLINNPVRQRRRLEKMMNTHLSSMLDLGSKLCVQGFCKYFLADVIKYIE